MDWTSGYVSEVGYTHGYYRELAPGQIDFALLLAGYEAPERAGMRYLELGFGQGLSVNVHAAAAPGEYWGVDFNPVHAANAQSVNRASGAEARLCDDSFVEFARRDDLPAFDYIVLHGVWSWISDENRGAIVRIIRDRLKVGGVVYISYNALPGWAATMPLRHLMASHIEAAGTPAQGMAGRIDAALAFGAELAEADARYFTANPSAKARLDAVAKQNRSYLAHEYFNHDWTPMYFSEVHRWLSEAKLSYAAPASALDQLDAYNLSESQRRFLQKLGYEILRETARDYLLNRQFRKDLNVRGARRLSPFERSERLGRTPFALNVEARSIPSELPTARGKLSLKKEVFEPLIAALAEDDGAPKRPADLARRPELAAQGPGALLEALAALTGAGWAGPVQSEAAAGAAAPRCTGLNAHFLERARLNADIACLASPLAGAGVAVGRFDQMFLDARARGKAPGDWAEDAWQLMARQNQSIVKDGQALKTAAENLEELSSLARTLAEHRLDSYRRLRLVD